MSESVPSPRFRGLFLLRPTLPLASVCSMRNVLLACLLLLALGPLQAKVYKSVLPDGTVVYSDTPPSEGAEQVELPEIQTYTPPPLPPSSPSSADADDSNDEGYESFEVTLPANDATVRDNNGSVKIALALTPGLRRGHKVEIFLDGKSIGAGGATSASLNDVDRGTHNIYAIVRNDEGKELARTPSSVFHLKRATRLGPTRGGS